MKVMNNLNWLEVRFIVSAAMTVAYRCSAVVHPPSVILNLSHDGAWGSQRIRTPALFMFLIGLHVFLLKSFPFPH
jgi:hypothetical protein